MWSNLRKHPAFPYCFPFTLCIVLVALRDLHPYAVYVLYPIQTICVGASILWLKKNLPSLKPSRWVSSTAVGILGVVLWIGLDHVIRQFSPDFASFSWISAHPNLVWFLDHLFLKHEPGTGFNPWILDSVALSWFVVILRVAGPTLVIPFMEEIFWRGFLMRYLIQEDFEKIKLGTYTTFSFLTVTIMFALIHGWQWPLGVVVGLLYGGWFVFTKNLGNVILAHAVTNLLLGLYILKTGQWWFW